MQTSNAYSPSIVIQSLSWPTLTTLTSCQRLHHLLQSFQSLILFSQFPPQLLDLPPQIMILVSFIFLFTLIVTHSSPSLSRPGRPIFSMCRRFDLRVSLRLMAPSQMLVQVLLSGKPNASTALAVLVRTHAACLGPAVLTMNFTLVSEETS